MEIIVRIKLDTDKANITPIYPRPCELDSKPLYWEIHGVQNEDIAFFAKIEESVR